jgi:hypothetical protein
MNQQAEESRLRVHGADRRGKMYAEIARVHKDLCRAKWMAQTANKKCAFSADNVLQLVLHLEGSVAFLAEELLEVTAGLEKEKKGEPDEKVD